VAPPPPPLTGEPRAVHTDSPRTQSGLPAAVVIDVPAPAAPATSERAPAARRTLRAAVAIGTWIALGLAVAALATVTVGPRLGLFQVETVLSGSMEPTFRPGDLLVVVPERLTDIRAGQVLSFHAPTPGHRVETHRVVRVINPGPHPVIITKGDANSAPDPWHASLHGTTAWRMVGVVPYAGAAIRTLRQPWIHVVAVLLVPLLLAAAALHSIWRPEKPEEETAA
jgi:signal peptidase I